MAKKKALKIQVFSNIKKKQAVLQPPVSGWDGGTRTGHFNPIRLEIATVSETR